MHAPSSLASLEVAEPPARAGATSMAPKRHAGTELYAPRGSSRPMEVRDAVEDDAESLARLADGPRDVLRNVIHDRTVRVVEDEDSILAFVSFDARPGTVYVTQIGGAPGAIERLLEEPIRFARREGMRVELLIEEDDQAVLDAIVDAGFDRVGRGPRFDDVETLRYRYSP